MLTEIEWIFFDIGGVLTDESRRTEWRYETLAGIIGSYGRPVTPAEIQAALPKASAIIGNLTENFLSLFLSGTELDSAKHQFKKRKADFPNYGSQQVARPEGLAVVQQLSEKYKLGVIANQHTAVKDKPELAKILKYFHHSTVSHEYNLEKPDPRIFTTVLHETGADPARSAIVDDNVERSLVPAKTLGMLTVWYKLYDRENVPANVVDFTVGNLNELTKIFL